MKNLLIAIFSGIAVVIGLSFVTTWPFALAGGVSVGYLGYRFQQETWPIAQSLAKGFWENKWDVLGITGACLAAIAALLGLIYVASHIDLVKIGSTAFIVAGYLLFTGVALYFVVGILYGLGHLSAMCLGGAFHLVGLDAIGKRVFNYRDPHENTPKHRFWFVAMVSLGVLSPALLAPFLNLLALRLVLVIYSRERLVIAISVAAGGWVFYAERWASQSALVSAAVGLLVGGLLGAIQYQLITLPLQRRFAAKARLA